MKPDRSRDRYLQRVRQPADDRARRGYPLTDDIPRVMQRAADSWDLVTR